MRTLHVVAAALALAGAAVLASRPAASREAPVSDVAVLTARGVDLKATLHRPAAANGTAVVLAPGQGYHRELALMKRSAEALADAGFVALRFDWAYFTAKGEVSADFAAEIADLDAAVAFARKVEGVERVLVAGKSLGSLVAAKWTGAHAESVAGLALLTLPVNDPQDPEKPFDADDTVAKLPLEPLIVCGDRDALADRRALYRLAARMTKTPQVVVVPGDHGFGVPSKDEAEKLENVDLAVRALVVWAKRRTGP